MNPLVFHMTSLDDTHQLGVQLGQNLTAGTILLLHGEMGAGKTTLSKAICEGLGVSPQSVISPTYTIVNMYQGRLPVHHLDLYRLQSPEDLEDFDWNDLICEDGVTLVEWPQILLPWLENQPVLNLTLEIPNPQSRLLKLQSEFQQFSPLLDHMRTLV